MEIFRLLKSVVAVHNSMSNLRVLFVSFSNQSSPSELLYAWNFRFLVYIKLPPGSNIVIQIIRI